MNRYENWQKMRQLAKKNGGKKLPSGVIDDTYPPPPPPADDPETFELSLDMNAVALEDLDESGIERVPRADPGLDEVRWHLESRQKL